MGALAGAGLDHVQISVQDTERRAARLVAGAEAFDAKIAAAGLVKRAGLALSLNVVLHSGNVDRAGEMVDLAASLGAERIEVASTQYHGWALENRAALLPTRAALAAAAEAIKERRKQYAGALDVVFVLPDYVTDLPKPCMDGWGQRSLTVAPDGRVLPCPGATSITSLAFDNVLEKSLGDIWRTSRAFETFRGEAWMKEPCASCDRRGIDFGGCRCQAFALTGDASRTDPACAKAPDHPIILSARREAEERLPRPSLVYRGLRQR